VLDKALGGDSRHDYVGVVTALALAVNQREREGSYIPLVSDSNSS
jgi:hypothetical protein